MMTDSLPRISLVTPSFNQNRFLELTLRSVIEQEYPDLEYIVIDGGSSDGSVETIERYQKHLTYWESKKDTGPGDALNKGFSRTTGEVMGWLNADDVYLPRALSIVGSVFQTHPQIDWLTSGSINISEDGRVFQVQPARKHYSPWVQIFNYSPPPQHCTFWRRRLWEKAGSRVTEATPYMDCELWLRFYEHNRPYLLDTVLAAWRLHHRSFSMKNVDAFYRNMGEAHQPFLREYRRKHPSWRLLEPLLRLYFRWIDRGILNRIYFELVERRTRLLTLDLQSGRFKLGQAKGLLPRPWPQTMSRNGDDDD
jgi:glycosyltransferase involved in cell wall biosynthesis